MLSDFSNFEVLFSLNVKRFPKFNKLLIIYFDNLIIYFILVGRKRKSEMFMKVFRLAIIENQVEKVRILGFNPWAEMRYRKVWQKFCLKFSHFCLCHFCLSQIFCLKFVCLIFVYLKSICLEFFRLKFICLEFVCLKFVCLISVCLIFVCIKFDGWGKFWKSAKAEIKPRRLATYKMEVKGQV